MPPSAGTTAVVPAQGDSEPSSGAPQRTAPPAEGAVDAHGLPVAQSSGSEIDQYGLGPSPGPPRFGADGQGTSPTGNGAEGVDQYGLGLSSGAPRFGPDNEEQYGPRFGPGSEDQYVPSSGGPQFGAGDDRFGFDTVARPGPRIEPSPPRQRNKLVLGILAGLLAGLLIFGAGGFFLGRGTAGGAATEPSTPSTAPSAVPSLGVYEQNQVELNQAKLTGALAPAAQGWLPYLSNCEKNGEPGGPILNKGEKTRVRCRLDGMSVIFVEYATVTDRDKARVKTLSQNVDARTLTPGVGPAGDKPAPSGRTSGSYVEYAYSVEEDRVRQTVAGIWWDDTPTPVAAYLLAFWKSGAGEDWAPMRDLWGRYA